MKYKAVWSLSSALSLALASLTLFSCNSSSTDTAEDIVLDSVAITDSIVSGPDSIPVSYDLKYVFPKNQDSLRYHLQGEIFGKDAAALEPLKALEFYKKQILDQAINVAFVCSGDAEPDSTADSTTVVYQHGWEFQLNIKSPIIMDKVYSVIAESYTFTGGAHGLSGRQLYSFNRENGQRITPSDIFRPDSDAELTQIITAALIKAYNVKNEQELYEQSISDIRPTDNFMITPEGITFAYLPYEIAPYYMGIIEVKLTWEELKNIIRPESIVKEFLKRD